MKKQSLIKKSILILLGPIGAYIGFYPNISCKPYQAGFWIIIVLGMATGIVLTLIAQSVHYNKKNKSQ
jgi:hypothetical protein